MPEELKLLPCPACGCTTPSLYNAQWEAYVECSECFMRGPYFSLSTNRALAAEVAWNALPRALEWTTEPPTAPGLYAVILYDENQQFLRHYFALPDAEDTESIKYWLGPLPSPFGVKL